MEISKCRIDVLFLVYLLKGPNLIHITIWMFDRTRLVYNINKLAFVGCNPTS